MRIAQKNLKPTHCCTTIKATSGLLAQRLEQGTHNPLVAGSNPAGPTIFVVNNRTFEFSLTAVKANRKIYYIRQQHSSILFRFRYFYTFQEHRNQLFLNSPCLQTLRLNYLDISGDCSLVFSNKRNTFSDFLIF